MFSRSSRRLGCFGSQPSASRVWVTGFVADIRARSERVRDALDPQTAERVVVSALTSDDLDDLDAEELTKTKMLLLAAIIADEHLDDAGLDELLAAARKLADQLMS
jgi:hypothetical protein